MTVRAVRAVETVLAVVVPVCRVAGGTVVAEAIFCLLYTSDAADERSSVDLGGRRIIKKKNSADI